MNLRSVPQGGDWMRRRELMLTSKPAVYVAPPPIAMSGQRVVSICQPVRHTVVSRGGSVQGELRPFPARHLRHRHSYFYKRSAMAI
jgi:hypothetical protein